MKWLAVVSFAESSFFPVPPDAMIVPMVLARPERAWRIATVCTIASVIGGFFGYAIGYFLLRDASASRSSISTATRRAFDKFQHQFQEWGLWIILIKGLTPIPYKIVTIASGVAHFDLAGVRARLAGDARRPLLSGGGAAQGLRPAAAHVHRALSDAGDDRLLLLIVGGFVALKYV